MNIYLIYVYAYVYEYILDTYMNNSDALAVDIGDEANGIRR